MDKPCPLVWHFCFNISYLLYLHIHRNISRSEVIWYIGSFIGLPLLLTIVCHPEAPFFDQPSWQLTEHVCFALTGLLSMHAPCWATLWRRAGQRLNFTKPSVSWKHTWAWQESVSEAAILSLLSQEPKLKDCGWCAFVSHSAASGKLRGGTGSCQEGHPPLWQCAEALPHHQPPQQSHVLCLWQRPVGWKNRPHLQTGSAEMESEIF